jgi:methionyl-tRNA formyltransferase
MTGSELRIAYAGNRRIGLDALKLLVRADIIPKVLFVADADRAECVAEMRALAPDALIVADRASWTPARIDALKALHLDHILSVHFPHLFPQRILDTAERGSLNLHPAYLPFNRGWHSPTWAILDGGPYGATLHWMVEEADAGEIALRRRLEVMPEDTAHSLYQRVLRLELDLLAEAIPALIQGTLSRAAQEPGGSFHRKSDLAGVQTVRASDTATFGSVLDRFRALTTNAPAEATRVMIDGRCYRVRVELAPDE